MQQRLKKERRSYDDDEPTGYMESDNDYVQNNFDLVVWLLDSYCNGHGQGYKASQCVECQDNVCWVDELCWSCRRCKGCCHCEETCKQ